MSECIFGRLQQLLHLSFRTIAAVALIGLGGRLRAADPYVAYIYPSSLQAGTTNRVVVGGQFLGGLRGGDVSGARVTVLSAELVPGFPAPPTSQRRYLTKWLDQIAAGDRTAPPLPENEDARVNEWPSNRWWSVLGTLDAQQISLVEQYLFTPRNALQMSPAMSQKALVTIAVDADAALGARDFRLWTPSGCSPPRPLIVTKSAHLQEPLYTAPHRSQPARPELGAVPCWLDGQIDPGQTDAWRMPGLVKGRVLTFQAVAREFQPYIGDAVPGFFNPVLRIVDDAGHEVALADDFFYHPDSVLTFTVPADGDYTLEIHDNLYRGRDDFVYSIKVTEGSAARPKLGGLSLSPLPDLAVPTNALIASFTGVVAQPGTVATNAFEIAEAGDYVFDLLARRAGSPLDARFVVYNAAGTEVFRCNDVTNIVHLGSIIQAECDPVGRVRLEAGAYTACVTDEAQKGGGAYGYTLRIHRPSPRFDVWAKKSGLVLRPWAKASLPLTIVRHDGFDQPIHLENNAYLTFKPQEIPAGTNAFVVTATMKPHPPAYEPHLALWATAKQGERSWRVPVVPANEYNQAFAWNHLVRARGFAFRALPAPPPKKPPAKPDDKNTPKHR